MDHQNWEYTTLSKNKPRGHGEKAMNQAMKDGKDVESIKKGTGPNHHGITGSKIHKVLEQEEYKVETVSVDFRVALMQARQAKNLTQVQLAKNINEKQSVISDYESGKAIPNPQIISKLERALGARLPRQKKQKKKASED